MKSTDNTRYQKKWTEADAVKVQVLTRLHSERTTEKITGIPQPTVNRLKNRVLSPNVSESIKNSNESVAKALSGIRTKLIGELSKVKEARNANDYKALATSMGIITDKILLLTGGPTEIIGIMGLVDRPDNELDQILHGNVEIADAEPCPDNKHYVSLEGSEGSKGPKISNPGADKID